jgi:hypothetical protein
MKTLPLLVHWFKKDLRENRNYIIIFCLLLPCSIFWERWLAAEPFRDYSWKVWGVEFHNIIVWLFLFLILLRIFHTESPLDEDQYWLTRPISGGTLFTAKFILSLTLCALALIPVAVLYWDDYSRVFGKTSKFSHYLLYWSIALAASIFISKGKSRLDMSYLGAMFIAFFLIPAIYYLALLDLKTWGIKDNIFMLVAIGGTGSWMAMLHQYWTRRTRRSWVILAAAWAIPLYLFMIT